MIKTKFVAVDSSSMIAYFQGQKGGDVDIIADLLEERRIILPPIVLCELLSDPKLPKIVAQNLSFFPLLEITENYWLRVANLRSKLIAKKLKAKLADSMIAQICIDHKVQLITRDKDFKNFIKYSDLKLFEF